jgi:hypothetical protein
MAFKMKGAPMKRNFGIGGPMKQNGDPEPGEDYSHYDPPSSQQSRADEKAALLAQADKLWKAAARASGQHPDVKAKQNRLNEEAQALHDEAMSIKAD